ncbi:MAG: arginine--tRNA ligase [Acidobacteriota bacterium]
MFVALVETVKSRVVSHVQNTYGYTPKQLVIEQPPKVEMGDLALPLCFELAKVLRKSPRQVAGEIAGSIGAIPGVAAVEVAGAGYLNLFFARHFFLKNLYEALARPPSRPETLPFGASGKIILEHTNINPNKAAHIGHLRNAVLGDTFARILRFTGASVEVQNYIDDTGVQVADVVVGFQHLEGKRLEDVKRIPGKFDYYCWDLYARVSGFYEQTPENARLRAETLRLIEEGHNETAELAHYVSHRIVQCHLNTMWRLGIQYDVLPRESDILHLKFWDYAFDLLKKSGAIYFEERGKNKGCWIMRLGTAEVSADESETAEQELEHEEDKIIVRSNGTVTYVGKDIAYQLWKLGLLGMDFYYQSFHRYEDGHIVYMTDSRPSEQPAGLRFGSGNRVYNVIDSRQAYLQNIVIAGLRALGYSEQADRSSHFSYEMVALSPRCCADLGIQLSDEDKRRPYVEVSGRKGLGVKADDLIDTLLDNALQEVKMRHPELNEEEARRLASAIAVSALRYFLLKYTRNSVIAFDFKEALSFEGETGPYVQYAVVRANNIFRKVQESDPACRQSRVDDFITHEFDATLCQALMDDELWRLATLAAQLESQARVAVQTSEPATVAKYLFTLAQAFNNFYHRHRIISEPDPQRKLFLLALTRIIRDQLQIGLSLLGIQVPEKM